MIKEILRLLSSIAMLAAVIIGVMYADKTIKRFKDSGEDIIDL